MYFFWLKRFVDENKNLKETFTFVPKWNFLWRVSFQKNSFWQVDGDLYNSSRYQIYEKRFPKIQIILTTQFGNLQICLTCVPDEEQEKLFVVILLSPSLIKHFLHWLGLCQNTASNSRKEAYFVETSFFSCPVFLLSTYFFFVFWKTACLLLRKKTSILLEKNPQLHQQ